MNDRNTHQFGVRDVALSPDQIERHHAVARKHGATFIYLGRTAGTPTTGWFEAAPQPSIFERSRLALAVLADLRTGAKS